MKNFHQKKKKSYEVNFENFFYQITWKRRAILFFEIVLKSILISFLFSISFWMWTLQVSEIPQEDRFNKVMEVLWFGVVLIKHETSIIAWWSLRLLCDKSKWDKVLVKRRALGIEESIVL